MGTPPMARTRWFGVGALFVTLLAWGGPLRADGAADNETFQDFIFNGCMLAMTKGIAIDLYAQGNHLMPANPNLAASFLQGRPGTVYMKATAQTVLIIAQGAGGYCTAATRVAPDLAGLQQAVDAKLQGAGVGLVFVKEDHRVLGGGPSTTREYDGKIGNTPLGAKMSIAPNSLPQAVFTVYRKSQ